MFSFRTTPLEEQLDKALVDGKVACFCTQNCWDTEHGRYMYEIFAHRGNLVHIFSPRDTELTPLTNHIEFSLSDLQGLNAVVVEIQDVGTRYFNYTKDVFALMEMLNSMEEAPSLYIVDHINPAGRSVEGTMPCGKVEAHTPKIVHRHGLTLGELCNLYYNEIGARFALHVISASATDSNRQLMPWTIAPCSDIPGLFTCDMYSGGGLWNNTNISAGIGTARPYEYIGSPFVKHTSRISQSPVTGVAASPSKSVVEGAAVSVVTPSVGVSAPPEMDGVMLRPCSFTPACGRYEGKKCYGYQIILQPGAEYHSFLHTMLLMRYFKDNYPEFNLETGFEDKLSDALLVDYILGKATEAEMRDHIKVEEQKWIRKAKKFMLYEDQPYRLKV